MSVIINLNENEWLLFVDSENNGLKEGWQQSSWLRTHEDEGIKISIPHSWQTMKALDRYEGTCWYFTRIPRKELEKAIREGKKIFIKFKGANYKTTAWLDGIKLGENEGGFLPFKFHLESSIIESNLDDKRSSNNVTRDNGNKTDIDKMMVLAVRVNNSRNASRIPGILSDWFQWGGIYRDAHVEACPRKRVIRCFIRSNIIDFTPDHRQCKAQITLEILGSRGLNAIWRVMNQEGSTIASGKISDENVRNDIPRAYDDALYHDIKILIKKGETWSPERPYLHVLSIVDDSGNELYNSSFGLRQLKIKENAIFLNEKRVLLKGCSLHEEKYPHGRDIPFAERKKDLEAMKKLGFNFLRTAHYSHDESTIKIADEIGLLIGEEIPVYWKINYKDRSTLKLAHLMLRKLVFRDFNHPSVIWWSVGNEVPVARKDCQVFIKSLLAAARKLDPDRIACFVSKNLVYDPLRKHVPIVLFNGYFGWYYGSARTWTLVTELIHGTATKKPIIISEFGAAARFGFGRHEPLDEKFSEWKQASIISHSIKVFNSKPFIQGWLIWIFRDFRSHMRLNKYQEGYNRKGLFNETGKKKLIAAWFPRLKDQAVKYRRFQTILGMFLSKMLWPLNAFLGIFIDFILPVLAAHQGRHFYLNKV
ncbi:MAG: glycoside hydrolase family 2 protein [Promethearchaeota archaeon]